MFCFNAFRSSIFPTTRKVLRSCFDSVGKDRVLWEHLRCGLHSGIPSCCILWYVTGWKHLVCGRWWTYQPYWRAMELSQWAHGRRFDHVPCPVCLALGRVVELRDCDCQA